MTDIRDIKILHIKKFLELNNKKIENDVDIYDMALSLMRNPDTKYDDDISIIEWMLAHNALKSKISIPKYTIIELQNLQSSEFNKLAKSLGLSKNNINNVINILKYMDKLDTDFEQDLNRELLHTKIVNKKYYSEEILDLKINDRLTDGDFNYKVIYANKNKVTVQKVDLLGNPSGDKKQISIKKEQYHRRGVGYANKFYWVIDDKKLRPGMLLYDYGPEIDSIDSIYLKYKTLPDNIPKYVEIVENSSETIYYIKGKSSRKSNYYRKPEINMLVNIEFSFSYGNDYYRDYVITNIIDNKIDLLYVGNNDYIENKPTPNNLVLTLINNEWMLEKNDVSDTYTITIGGFGEGTQEHYYD